jgi:hypothetical protein
LAETALMRFTWLSIRCKRGANCQKDCFSGLV